jgi:hypothetical protein
MRQDHITVGVYGWLLHLIADREQREGEEWARDKMPPRAHAY